MLDGINEALAISQMVRHYVNNDLCKEEMPSCSNRAYYPNKDNIKNHLYMVKNCPNLISTI